MKSYNQGWKNESARHSLSAKGVKTGHKSHSLFEEGIKKPLNEDSEDLKRLEGFADETGFSVEFLKKFESENGEILKTSETGFGYGFNIETDQGEFMVFENDDEAEKEAVARVLEDLENEPELFVKSWLEGEADMDAVNEELETIFDESNQNYVDDIESEGRSEHHNRLREELLKRGLISEEEADDEKFDLDDAKEKMVDEMTEENMKEGIDDFRSNYGEEEASKILMRHIDYDEAAKNAVGVDGVAHFLASYDGQEDEIDGHYIYRTN
jgi:hypothetical protein